MEQRTRVISPLPPVYDTHSVLLILGTMPSPKSREIGFYYGHPQNRFWKVLSALFCQEIPSGREEKIRFLLEHRIALWDVLASCDIAGASDASIRRPIPNDLRPLLRESGIRHIFTTGGKAAAFYRIYSLPQTGMAAISLPSTSPANARMSLEALQEAYRPVWEVWRRETGRKV